VGLELCLEVTVKSLVCVAVGLDVLIMGQHMIRQTLQQ